MRVVGEYWCLESALCGKAQDALVNNQHEVNSNRMLVSKELKVVK